MYAHLGFFLIPCSFREKMAKVIDLKPTSPHILGQRPLENPGPITGF